MIIFDWIKEGWDYFMEGIGFIQEIISEFISSFSFDFNSENLLLTAVFYAVGAIILGFTLKYAANSGMNISIFLTIICFLFLIPVAYIFAAYYGGK